MDCDDFLNLISARIDGEATAEEAERLEEHLTECAACRSVLATFEAHDRELRRAFAPERAAALDLAERAVAALPDAPMRKGKGGASFRVLLPFAAGLAAGLVIAGLLALFLVGGVREGEGPSSASTDVRPPLAATLALATGTCEVRRSESAAWEPLGAGEAILPGSRVRTRDGLGEILGADGSTVRLARGSELLYEEPRRWALAGGRLWTDVAEGERPFEVTLEEAVVAALGTRFDIERDEEEDVALLRVLEGATRVDAPDESRVVPSGFTARISRGVEISESLRHELLLSSAWIQDLLVLKGEGDEELSAYLDELLASLGHAKVLFLAEKEIRGLGESCVEPLLGYLESPPPGDTAGQRAMAARIVADLAPRSKVRELIQLLADKDPGVRVAAARGLERLTGTDQGLSEDYWKADRWMSCENGYLEWLDWWEREQGAVKKARAKRSPTQKSEG